MFFFGISIASLTLRNFVMWLLYQALESYADGHHTLDTVYKKWVWSWGCLWEGEEPTKDWKGNPIPGAVAGVKLMDGKFMAVWSLICDLEHCCKAYGMANPTNNCPCGLCPMDSKDLPWWDFRPNPAWKPKIYTVASWLAAGLKKSVIFDIVGVSVLSFYPDWMHCKSLGIDKPLIGFL